MAKPDGRSTARGPPDAAALQLTPGNDEPIFWRGSMKMATGDEEGAAADVLKAILRNERWRALIARIPEAIFPGAAPLCARLWIERSE